MMIKTKKLKEIKYVHSKDKSSLKITKIVLQLHKKNMCLTFCKKKIKLLRSQNKKTNHF